MSNIKLLPFQEKLILSGYNGQSSVLNNVRICLQEGSQSFYEKHLRPVVVFESPTGTGKTVMIATFIEELSKEENVSFLWLSPGKGNLTAQSKKKIKKMINKGLSFEDLDGTFIPDKDVLFVSWDEINDKQGGQWSNKIMNGEDGKTLHNVILNTKANRKLVVIIDESHENISSNSNSLEILQNIIKADVEIHVSATNKSRKITKYVTYVDDELKDEVIKSGIIKKSIILNQILDSNKENKTKEEFLLEQALLQLKKIKEEYSAIGSDINPLLLVQIGDNKAGIKINDKISNIENILNSFDINYDNGRLALWISESKKNTKEIEQHNNPVEVLIFKQAIATGWDCPRSHILVQFRDINSETLELQVLGRISRSVDRVVYKNELLDNAFIYTDLQDYSIPESIGAVLDFSCSKRVDVQNLPKGISSFYRENQGQQELESYGIYQKIPQSEQKRILKTIQVVNLNKSDESLQDSLKTGVLNYFDLHEHKESHLKDSKGLFVKSDKGIKWSFYGHVLENLIGYKNASSMKVVEDFILDNIDHGLEKDVDYLQLLVLNYEKLKNFVVELSLLYKKYNPIDNMALNHFVITEVMDYQIPSFEMYSSAQGFVKESYDKYFHSPAVVKYESEGERRFCEYLDSSDEVVWWYKSGTKKELHFGLNFLDQENKEKSFMVDFIFVTNSADGQKIWFVDVKGEGTADPFDKMGKDIVEKNNALKAFCNNKKFGGGIVVLNKGKFYIQTGLEYHYNKNELIESKGWTVLKLK